MRWGYDAPILAQLCFECLRSADEDVVFGAVQALEQTGVDPSPAAGRLVRHQAVAKPGAYVLPILRVLKRCSGLDEPALSPLVKLIVYRLRSFG